jgi:putative FmdB family regulatory protein
MPIYEYQCTECGHHMEALQKISDAPLKDCPACVSASLTRLVSASSFRLKGGGWYETDFKTGSKRHGTQADVADSGGAGSSPAPAAAKGSPTKESTAVPSGPAASKSDSTSGKSAAASE